MPDKRKGMNIKYISFLIWGAIAVIILVLFYAFFVKEGRRSMNISLATDGTAKIECDSGGNKGSYIIEQLPMTGEDGGACYAIKKPNGNLIMFDSGYESDGPWIAEYIKENGGKVDAWFITHPHVDHVGGFVYVLCNTEGVEIDKVYYSPFDAEFFETEAEGKNLETLNYASRWNDFRLLSQKEVPIKAGGKLEFEPLAMGQVLQMGDMKITCMYSFQPDLYDVNGNSLVLNVECRGYNMLITGDATDRTLQKMKEYWGTKKDKWEVDFMQVPHHGYQAAEELYELYDLANPDYAFVDCSKKEWDENAVGIRDHMQRLQDRQIKVIQRFKGINQIEIR